MTWERGPPVEGRRGALKFLGQVSCQVSCHRVSVSPMTTTQPHTCPACTALRIVKCNAHRTASPAQELIARAEAAGHVLPADDGTLAARYQRGLAAEKALNARPVMI